MNIPVEDIVIRIGSARIAEKRSLPLPIHTLSVSRFSMAIFSGDGKGDLASLIYKIIGTTHHEPSGFGPHFPHTDLNQVSEAQSIDHIY
jgi:hypothetical protein